MCWIAVLVLALIAGVLTISHVERAVFHARLHKWRSSVREYSHDINSLGYRSDCSGFVSYMWKVPRARGGCNDARDWFTQSRLLGHRAHKSMLLEAR